MKAKTMVGVYLLNSTSRKYTTARVAFFETIYAEETTADE